MESPEGKFRDCPLTPDLTSVDNVELFRNVGSSNFLDFSFGGKSYDTQLKNAITKTGQFCAMTCILRNLGGIPVVWMSSNFGFIGGSLGCAEGEKLCLGLEYAREHRIPAVIETRSGGVRMQEGTVALMQMAKVSVAVRGFRAAKLPYISVMHDPTYGGSTASFCMQGDIRIGVSSARIGFAGPNVILNTIYKMDQDDYDRNCPANFQTSEFLLANGQLDLVVKNQEELLEVVTQSLYMLYLGRKLASNLRVERKKGSFGMDDSAALLLAAEGARKQEPDSKPVVGKCAKNYTLSRGMDRYQPPDLVKELFSEFMELSGDGKVGNDTCMIGGFAQIDKYVCVVIATSKGHTQQELQDANYGMPHPQGYRQALKLMNMAEHFELPVITLVDTCGAYPSFSSEELGQAEAIATNLERMASLRVPIVTLIVGEGGSGGAIGIAMGDKIGMLSRAYYTVISPEGAASILGRYENEDEKKVKFPTDCSEIASRQRIYADDLRDLRIIDEVIWEEADVEGGKEEDFNAFPKLKGRIHSFILSSLGELTKKTPQELVAQRYVKFRQMGKTKEISMQEIEKLQKERESGELPPRQPASGLSVPSQENSAAKPTAKTDISKMLKFIADMTINSPNSAYRHKKPAGVGRPHLARMESFVPKDFEEHPKWILDNKGPKAVVEWLKKVEKDRVLITDTSMRDAHQSLIATRIRSRDLIGAAYEVSRVLSDAFSLEVWGGATFDVSYRFLHESPWERLRILRKRIPNILLQMLLRGSNAVGYKSYPDNAIEEFVRLAAKNGIDVFRIFDCFNDLEQMEVAISSVLKAGKICEVAMCFSGNFLSENEKIYTLDYFKDLAGKIDKLGAHIICIKDMAGLMRPQMVKPFMAALREVTQLPIHFHTHNTSAAAQVTVQKMAEFGCNIVDLAMPALSDLTSQPNMGAFLSSLEGSPRDPKINFMDLEPLDQYLSGVRRIYQTFESGLLNGSARVYDHQIPGGQFSNLFAQCKSMGTYDKWDSVLDKYRDVNKLFGDIIKVTPSSKSVGDMALYMISKGLTIDEVLEYGEDFSYPDSVVSMLRGEMSKPHHGFPPVLIEKILKGEPPLKERPGKHMEPVDIGNVKAELKKQLLRDISDEETMSYVLYPKVFMDYQKWLSEFGPLVMWLPSDVFFYGLDTGKDVLFKRSQENLSEVIGVESGSPKTEKQMQEEFEMIEGIRIHLSRVGPLIEDNRRAVVFRVNGRKDHATVTDNTFSKSESIGVMADPSDPKQVGSSIPGVVEKVFVKEGQQVKKGDKLVCISAMKMEVVITVLFDGVVEEIVVDEGQQVHAGNLICKVSPV